MHAQAFETVPPSFTTRRIRIQSTAILAFRFSPSSRSRYQKPKKRLIPSGGGGG